jgi:hypothetical protein
VFREFPLEIKAGSLDAGALHRQRRCREYSGAVTLEDRIKPLLKK